jgi:hypothetical protein
MDNFAQIMSGGISEAVAGTLAFSNRIELGYSLADHVGIIIHGIELFFSPAVQNLLLDLNDYIQFAMTSSDQLTTLSAQASNVIFYIERQLQKYGTAASGWKDDMPIVRDWTNLPGGGILVAPNPLYFAIRGVSMAAQVGASYRMYYTAVALSEQGFRELWETWNNLRT